MEILDERLQGVVALPGQVEQTVEVHQRRHGAALIALFFVVAMQVAELDPGKLDLLEPGDLSFLRPADQFPAQLVHPGASRLKTASAHSFMSS